MAANVCLENGRNLATIIASLIALAVYITNSIQQRKQRQTENAMRFLTAHQHLIQSPFIKNNRRAMETGSFNRASWNEQTEDDFGNLLGEIEAFALLVRSRAVSKTLDIYMFGWFAQKIQPILTAQERDNVYWELAVQYLDELKAATDDFYKKTKAERDKYHCRNHFNH